MHEGKLSHLRSKAGVQLDSVPVGASKSAGLEYDCDQVRAARQLAATLLIRAQRAGSGAD